MLALKVPIFDAFTTHGIPLSNGRYAERNHIIVSSSPPFLLKELSRFRRLGATTEKTLEDETTEQYTEPACKTRIVMESSKSNSNDADNDMVESRSGEEDGYGNSVEESDEDRLERRRTAIIAARLIKKGSTVKRSPSGRANTILKKTSVGTRREGSASRARSVGGGLGSSLLRGVKKGALAAAARQKAMENKDGPSNDGTAAVKKGIIQSTIDALLETQNTLWEVHEASSMGLLGKSNGRSSPQSVVEDLQEIGSQHLALPVKPILGSVLIHKSEQKASISMEVKDRIRNYASVRVATVKDDLEIAKLRLSVFSDFTPEIKRQFRTRSCEVLDHRRMKGATCLVVSVDYDDAGLEPECDEESRDTLILGSVECSSLEFAGTQLGMRRPGGSILYITEVAVSPRVRRIGAGTKLLQVRMSSKCYLFYHTYSKSRELTQISTQGIDELAKIRKIETVYLHVDVTNAAACKLYENGGYEILDSDDPVYNDFTTQLNLHDGATKGRNHYILHKKMTAKQTWFDFDSLTETKEEGTLGFEFPGLP